ncbi:MAG: hypothetical protein PHS14_10375 [Elusimicrobia bacterium]|nr:hypothetical protein [Elusimicrobiota bacterium]
MRMKTRPLATILTSAYISAMLASSVAPIRTGATLAAAVDPMAAEKALQNAISGLDVSGWAAATAGIPAPAAPAPKVVANNPPPKSDPLPPEEWIARLIKYTRTDPVFGSITAKMCAVLELCDGTEAMPLAMVKSDSTGAKRYFALPVNADSKDIVIMVETPLVTYLYLTDKTGKLRAAVISDKSGVRLITNERAAESFKAEVAIFAKEAEGLPPTGTAVAGNS